MGERQTRTKRRRKAGEREVERESDRGRAGVKLQEREGDIEEVWERLWE